MPEGKIRIRTLVKFLRLCNLTVERNRPLALDEITQELHCCRGNAYNYRRALRILFPIDSFDPNRERGPI